MKITQKIARFCSFSLKDQLLIGSLSLRLAGWDWLLRMFPYERLRSRIFRDVRLKRVCASAQREIRRQTMCLGYALKIVFWKPSCLRRALALRSSLAGQGVAAELRLGMGKGAQAHAWLVFEGKEILPSYGYRPFSAASAGGNKAFPLPRLMRRCSGELKLLIGCCLLGAGADSSSAYLAAVSQPVDWEEFFRLSEENMVTMLAYSGLRKSGCPVPAEVLSRLGEQKKMYVQHNLLLVYETKRLLSVLESAGVLCAVMKGPFLARRLYGDYGMRQSGDIDLLVRIEDFERAEHVLFEQGYRLLKERDEELAEDRVADRFVHGQYCKNYLMVELHREKKPRFTADWTRCFDRGECAEDGIRTFRSAVESLVLMEHAYKHMFCSLNLLFDTLMVCTQTGELPQIVQLAGEQGEQTVRLVAQSCGLIEDLFGCSVRNAAPWGVLKKVQPGISTMRKKLIVKNLGKYPDSGIRSLINRFILHSSLGYSVAFQGLWRYIKGKISAVFHEKKQSKIY